MSWQKTLLTCIAILLIAAGVVTVIFSTEPRAERSSAMKQTAMLVEVTKVARGDFRPTIVAMGSVRPEQEILLSPRVGGEIVSMSDTFTPGGFVEKGELLLEIDPTDYEATLLERKSELRQASAELEMELGRQDLARQDYEELRGTISEQYRTLVLRQPQLDTARAQVEAAQAAVRRAELDLERTRIRAPFAAHILTREANVGSQIAPGESLGHLVGIGSYWVEASVPVSNLQWIEIPQAGDDMGSPAHIRNRAAWREGVNRMGRVHSLIGALESQTRLARILLTVSDPLAHEPKSAGQPPLMIGSYVEARIEGRAIENVVRLERQYLRQDDTAWVNGGGVLEIRELDVDFRDDDFAYVSKGLEANDLVVTTNLATVTEGASLRLHGELE